MLISLEPYVRGNKKEFTQLKTAEAEDLVDSPGGAGLLLHVAYIYEQEVRFVCFFDLFCLPAIIPRAPT